MDDRNMNQDQMQSGQSAGDMGKVNPVQVQKFLKDVNYPVNKQELMGHAKDHGADDRVMNFLERIPERQYNGPNAVSQEIGRQE